MTNVTKEKSLKCIEWRLEVDSCAMEFYSETFSVQDQKCKLRFDSGWNTGFYSFLYIEVNKELQSPIAVIIRIMRNSENLDTLVLSLKYRKQEVWQYNPPAKLFHQLMIFEVYCPDDRLKEKQAEAVAECSIPQSIQLSSSSKTNIHFEALSRDFSKLLDDTLNCDVRITCEDKTFNAHRIVLGTRSSVLSAMLKSNMIESETGLIKIEDIKASIFQSFLHYLYSGNLPELNMETAKQLYETSDKYAVEELKKACTEYLIQNLSEDNACEVLVLANQHSDQDFRKSVISYIIDKKIPETGSYWLDFCESYAKLANEIMIQYIRKIRLN